MNDRRTENTPSVVELNIYIYSSLRASSPVWASEASLARTRERGADPLPLAASPLARASFCSTNVVKVQVSSVLKRKKEIS